MGFLREDFSIASFTYNVNENCPAPKTQDRRLIKRRLEESKSSCPIVAIALQEVSMSFENLLVLDTIKRVAGKGLDIKTSFALTDNAADWSNFIDSIFGESHRKHQVVCGGVMMILLIRKDIKVNVQHKEMRFGLLGGNLANKAAIGFYFKLRQDEFAIIGAHLEAHREKVVYRHDQLERILTKMNFKTSRGRLEPVSAIRNVIVMGDLNFRLTSQSLLNASGKLIEPEEFGDYFYGWDQLLANKKNSLREFKEYFDCLKVYFPLRQRFHSGEKLNPDEESLLNIYGEQVKQIRPTFKYIKGKVDQFNTKRYPSLPDRILYKGSFKSALYEQLLSVTMSDHKPVIEFIRFVPNGEI